MKLLKRHEEPEILMLPGYDIAAEIRRSVERIVLGVKGWVAAIEETTRTIHEAERAMIDFGKAAKQAKFEYRFSWARRLAHSLFGWLKR